MVWHFIGVYIINRTLHDRLEIRNFSSRVEKYFTRSLRSLVKYFSTLEEKFRISARPCNILYMLNHLIVLSEEPLTTNRSRYCKHAIPRLCPFKVLTNSQVDVLHTWSEEQGRTSKNTKWT